MGRVDSTSKKIMEFEEAGFTAELALKLFLKINFVTDWSMVSA